jgi:hypothetical protein
MKNRLYKLFLPVMIWVAVCAAGCTDGFENINPNEATGEMMEHDDLKIGSFFSQMLRNVFIVGEGRDADYQITQNLAGDIFAGYMGACNIWHPNNADNTTYNCNSDWYDAAFTEAFTNIMTPWSSIKDITKEEYPQKYAVATIVKVAGMHRITDMYGPLPYTNFGTGSLKNPYDSQETIYDAFFQELDEAIGILTDFNTDNPTAKALSSDYDFIYSGNVTNWIKFANSLKLRLAIRISYANPTKAQQEGESAVNHPIGVMNAAGDAAILNKSNRLSYRHPLYVICYEFSDIKMGATMDAYLNGYQDPRISAYFNRDPINGIYRGVRTGITISAKAPYAGGPFSTLNITPESPVVWLNPAEVYFLRAEGVLKGWNIQGTVQDLYETGIRTSFGFVGANNPDGYIANNTLAPTTYTDPVTSGNSITTAPSTITIRWDDAATPEQKLERIITQKWIATYPDGQEAWSEFRRTGYPKIFPVRVNNSGNKINTTIQIRRLPFPSTEYTNNSENVAQAVTLLGGQDNGGTKLWWDKK